MKRNIVFIVLLCNYISLFANGIEINGIHYLLNKTERTASVTFTGKENVPANFNTYKGYIVVPREVVYNDTTYLVTELGFAAFAYCSAMTSLSLPNSITTIGQWAFMECSGLTSIELPESVTSIGVGAFWKCTGIESFTIPKNVITVQQGAFEDCSNLAEVNIPNSITDWGRFLFLGCNNLRSVYIADGLKTIGVYMFSNCRSLTSIKLPNSITSIGEYAFQDCPLTELILPSSLQLIGKCAFKGCSQLTSIVIPDSVTRIQQDAFYGCTNLSSLTIGRGVTTIDLGAFIGCKRLKSIIIPENVYTIGKDIFRSCDSITSIEWRPKQHQTYESQDSSPFYSICKQINSFTIGDHVEMIPAYLCSGMNGVTQMTIPKSAARIENYAFQGCSGITSITIPENVIQCEGNAFAGCNSLTQVQWNAKNASNFTSSPFSASRGKITSFSFGDKVQHIPSNLCSGQSNLTSIDIPNTIKSIGADAFKDATGLTKINISDISAWCQIDFANESANPIAITHRLYIQGKEVIDVVLPDSVTQVTPYAFYSCTGLHTFTMSDAVTAIGNKAFYNCTELTDITFGSQLQSIGEYAFYNCTKIQAVLFGELLRTIGKYAFYQCSGLTSLTLPQQITSMGSWVFGRCNNLTSLHICEGIPAIPDHAFSFCSKLTSITIPRSVTSIGMSAFRDCSEAKWVILLCENVPFETFTFLNISPLAIFNYSQKPSACSQGVFVLYDDYCDYDLFVPAASITAYKNAKVWSTFRRILPIEDIISLDTISGEVTITTTDTTAILTWPEVTDADTYELTVKDPDGNIIVSITLNAQGQLTAIEYQLPKRNMAQEETKVRGFRYTIDNLKKGTTYTYEIVAKDNSGRTLQAWQMFFTQGGTSNTNPYIESNPQTRKILRNSRLYIQRDKALYTIQGTPISLPR